MSKQDSATKATSIRGGILVVDDNAANLRLLSQVLTTADYRVRPVTNGAQALATARSTPPDLILLDIMMPTMDGFEVCEKLKADEQTRDIPVIFLSALSATRDKVRAFKVGGVDYITKPFQAHEVLARVATHLAMQDLQKRLRAANEALEERNAELEARNAELQTALDTIKTLSGLIPICAWCGRKIEDEGGEWVPLETYIEDRSEASFTHGMCPDCLQKAKLDASEVLRLRAKGRGG